MIKSFAEADPGIENDSVFFNAGRFATPYGTFEKIDYFPYQIIIRRVKLHALGGSLHVHQYHGNIGFGRHCGHMGVQPQRTDIVNYGSPGIQCFQSHLRLVGIDADGDRDFFA